MAVFGGDVVHFCRFHVGRVADDPVELAVHGGEAVALADFDDVAHVVTGEVDARDVKRVRVEVGEDDFRLRLLQLGKDAEAAAAAAEVKDALRRFALRPPRREVARDEFGDGRARDEGAFVNVEFVTAVEGAAGEVRHGDALADTPLQRVAEGGDFGVGEAGGEVGGAQVVGQFEQTEDEGCGFVEGVVGAVAVIDVGGGEAARAVAYPVEQGGECVHGFSGAVRMSAVFTAFRLF